MPALTFTGGIHPYDGKDLSENFPIRTLFPHGELVFPLKQHIGKPAIPVVRPGDAVLTGQMIGAPNGIISAAIHSSVSGVVTAIEPRPVVNGREEMSIVIRSDGKFNEIFYPEPRRLSRLTAGEIIDTVRDAGIVGMGGAGLPTHIKLAYKYPERIDYCIANCIECEPYLTSDYRRMIENPAKVINGLRIVLRVFPNAHGILAVDEKRSDVYHMFRDLTRDDPTIFVKRLRSKFPQGSERQLIYALTGRTLTSRMLPSDIGCVVNNVDTLVAVNQAVMVYEPLLTRLVTVTGDGVRHPRNFRVRIGMSYRELLTRAGGIKGTPAMYIDGGTMTGRRIENLDVPVTKLTSAITVLQKDRASRMKELPCIRCGRCVSVCPNHLVPAALMKDIAAGDEKNFTRHNGLECNDCGCCSYICPSRLPLADRIYDTKKQILRDPRKAGTYSRRLIHE